MSPEIITACYRIIYVSILPRKMYEGGHFYYQSPYEASARGQGDL